MKIKKTSSKGLGNLWGLEIERTVRNIKVWGSLEVGERANQVRFSMRRYTPATFSF